MRLLKKTLKILGIFIGVLLLLAFVFAVYVWRVSDIKPPKVEDTSAFALQKQHVEGSLYTIGDNWIRKNQWGLWEMYVSGDAFEQGVKRGKLSQQQIVDQEAAFTAEIKRMIPSPGYLKFIRYVVGFMNRDLPEHVSEEYKAEIYGISHAAADSFNWIGNNYARILNYHAAHDIGHALQNWMLVGCTSFGAWGDKTAEGSMLIGRNFDFWVGDKFAEHKIVTFHRPAKGHAFASITWGGFTGVVSGMNEKGLTVTINAARSDIPFAAATPVSLVAREVLQYASNIKEAVAIAGSRKMFVSESFLVGSAADKKAVVIEKTPNELHVYDPQTDHIQCTNHYQSEPFLSQQLNVEQKDRSASVYRYQRLQELMQSGYPLTPEKMAGILRDRRGIGNASIGDGNEKAVNQLIAHHSIIFQPDSLRFWVSTAPWQLGEYICYDLKTILSKKGLKEDKEIANAARNIAADTFLKSDAYVHFLRYRKNKIALLLGHPVDTAEVVHSNPNLYDAYRIAGDYCRQQGWYQAAIGYYRQALQREVATKDEREAITDRIKECEELSRKS